LQDRAEKSQSADMIPFAELGDFFTGHFDTMSVHNSVPI
jgi:hypothetical protein